MRSPQAAKYYKSFCKTLTSFTCAKLNTFVLQPHFFLCMLILLLPLSNETILKTPMWIVLTLSRWMRYDKARSQSVRTSWKPETISLFCVPSSFGRAPGVWLELWASTIRWVCYFPCLASLCGKWKVGLLEGMSVSHRTFHRNLEEWWEKPT